MNENEWKRAINSNSGQGGMQISHCFLESQGLCPEFSTEKWHALLSASEGSPPLQGRTEEAGRLVMKLAIWKRAASDL